MKRVHLLGLLIFFSTVLYSQDYYVCRFGFTFEVSPQSSWGFNKPVVLSVSSPSPARNAGLKVNDIIESINDKPTDNQSVQIINDWLQNGSETQIRIKVSNLQYSNKEIALTKDCKLFKAIDENVLADAYSFYSLENMQSRSFICPFKTTVNPKANLLRYKTFSFQAVSETNTDLDNLLNSRIRRALEQRGLVYKESDADLIVHTFYSYNQNLNFSGNENSNKLPLAERYNLSTKKMETLPIYYHPLINQKQARFLLNFGIRLIDRNRSVENNLFVAWECEASEMLSEDYRLENYAPFHIPLMLMQYPYPQTTDVAKYRLKMQKYNFTGVSYNMDDLREIVDVDRFSPAFKAGLKPGDEVEKINGVKLSGNSETMSSDYKQFIYKTMNLRDPKTTFTDANGFTKCMLWDKMQYANVAEIFKKQDYSTTFSYLFYFAPYINLSGSNVISFEIKREKQKMEFKVTPEIQTGFVFENYGQ